MNRCFVPFVSSFRLLCAASVLPLLVQAQEPDQPASLPAPEAGVIRFPLDEASVARWQAVGEGTELSAGEGRLAIRYERSGRAAFGAGFGFAPGDLSGLKALVVELGEGGKGATLLISLRNSAGGVHSFAPTRLDGDPKTLRLDVADLRADAFQNRGSDPGPFDASRAVILSLTDIGGFFGAAPEDVRFTLNGLRAEVGPRAPGVASPQDLRIRPTSAGAQLFLRALVDGEGPRDAAIPMLIAEAMQRPDEPDAFLWLGLNQLWLAAEGDRSDPRTLEHVLLADRWFDRYAQVGGSDPRVPSWSVPAKLSVHNVFEVVGPEVDLLEPLREAYREDPGFHGFSMGLVGFQAPVGSRPFQEGLQAVRATIGSDRDDPSVQNRKNWPHNVEGFLLFSADYEQRAGNEQRALELLDRIERVEEFADWPFKGEVARRRELWMDDRDVDHQGGWMQAQSCSICHRR